MASAAIAEPADAEAETEAGAAAGSKSATRSKRRRLVLMAAPLILGVAGAGFWFSGFLPGGAGHAGAKASGKPVIFPVPELVANLTAPAGVERYVKVSISLVAANAAAAAAARKNLPRLQDLFLTYLRDMHVSELQSSIGTWRLREALIARAAVVLGPGQITDVLFTNLLIQ